jgi:murein DD-endopeptidase MepM/ murein hydrolase activator NlpD
LKNNQFRHLFYIAIWLFLITSLAGFSPTAQASGAYYVVKEGDTLWGIASRFNVSVNELQELNSLPEDSVLSAGIQLIIPGISNYQGEVDTIIVNYGENLHSLSRRYQISQDLLAMMNSLTSPQELYAGANLIVPAFIGEPRGNHRVWVQPGITILELAVKNNRNPWSMILDNKLSGSWGVLPGDVLIIPGDEIGNPGALPESIDAVEISVPAVQGKTFIMKVMGKPPGILSGSLNSRELRFFPIEGGLVAMQGIDAMTESGFYPLTLKIEFPDSESNLGLRFEFSQNIFIRNGSYPFDPPLTVPPETLDPDITEPEDALWTSLGEPFTNEKMWEGTFVSPVPDVFRDCWTSTFGNRRSYNGSPYNRYHSGLDFCGGVGTELYAPAAGKVIFAGPLTVRGNAAVIDHGWGVYTAYAHLSELFVKVGDFVQPGELIGMGGETGRVTGPHLHWEVWVGGVQVDPAEWLADAYP